MTAVILPLGKTQFIDAEGAPLASGSVYYYVPATTTDKSTWQDSGKSTLNTNPVVLDSAGRAIIYGEGIYRQLVKDSLGNTIWDQLVTAPLVGSVLPAYGTAGGTANTKTVATSPSFDTLTEGQILVVKIPALGDNSGATTLNANSTGGLSVVLPDGTVLVGDELQAGGIYIFVYTSTAWMLLTPNIGQGTWTPTIALGGGSVTMTTAVGFYYRIGNRVFIDMEYRISAAAAPSGAWTFTGLPYTSINTANRQAGLTISAPNGIATLMGYGAGQVLLSHIAPNSGTISMVAVTQATNGTATAGGNIPNAVAGITLSGSYQTNT